MSANAELLILKGLISDLPQEHRDKILALRDQLKTIITESGDDGLIALSLVGAELSAS